MARPSASDGGRGLSIHLLLAAAAAVAVQSPDPLAPLSTQPAPAAPLMVGRSKCRSRRRQHPRHRTRPTITRRPAAAGHGRSAAGSDARSSRWRPFGFRATGRRSSPRSAAGRWAEAQAGIASLPQSILTPVAKAELYTAKGSPVVSLGQIQAFSPKLPTCRRRTSSPAWRSRAERRPHPEYAARRPTTWLGNSPSRSQGEAGRRRAAADQLRSQLDPLIKADDAINAELLLMQTAPYLSYEARAEAGQRVAWAYFAVGRDADARRVADTYRAGAIGEWANQSAWVSGLASWRLNDCNAASNRLPRGRIPRAAARTWLRAAITGRPARSRSCRRPQAVAPLLKAAADSPESFYGLLARETLGVDKRLPPDVHNGIGRVAEPAERPPRRRTGPDRPALARRGTCSSIRRRSVEPQEHHGADRGRQASWTCASAQYWLAHNGQIWRRRRRRRSLSHPALDAAQRLAHRSRAGARAHASGIELPRRRRQPGGRRRPDAGPADHRERRWRAATAMTSASLFDPYCEHRIWAELHRDDAPSRAPRRASFRRSSPPTMPVRCRSRAGPTWRRRIRCCGSNPSPIGRRAITSLRSSGTSGSIRAWPMPRCRR